MTEGRDDWGRVALVVRVPRVPGGARALRRSLAALGKRAARSARRRVDLTYVCLGAEEMTAAHERSLGIAEVTDVLSFPMPEGPTLKGEVLLGVSVAEGEARRRGHPGAAELLLYAVHGTLHLLGWDDHTRLARRQMRAAERRWLRALGREPVFGRSPRKGGSRSRWHQRRPRR